LNFRVTKKCSDLIITNIAISPANPSTTDLIRFKVTVKNIGSSATTPSVLAIRVGGESNPKLFNIPAYTDYTKKVAECNENNNTKYLNFRVTKKCSDLIIQNIAMSPLNPSTSDVIKFKITVKNIGSSAANLSVLAIRVGGETNPKLFNIPVLNPNATRTVIRAIRLNVAQNYRTTAYADYTNRVKECNERNNTKYLNFRVSSRHNNTGSQSNNNSGNQNTPPPPPPPEENNMQNQNNSKCFDMKIESLTWKHSSKDYTFSIKVRNSGPGKTPSFQVMLSIGKLNQILLFQPFSPGNSVRNIKIRTTKIIVTNFNVAQRLDPLRKMFYMKANAKIIYPGVVSGCPPSSHMNQVYQKDFNIKNTKGLRELIRRMFNFDK